MADFLLINIFNAYNEKKQILSVLNKLTPLPSNFKKIWRIKQKQKYNKSKDNTTTKFTWDYSKMIRLHFISQNIR